MLACIPVYDRCSRIDQQPYRVILRIIPSRSVPLKKKDQVCLGSHREEEIIQISQIEDPKNKNKKVKIKRFQISIQHFSIQSLEFIQISDIMQSCAVVKCSRLAMS